MHDRLIVQIRLMLGLIYFTVRKRAVSLAAG
jgi:hypothetical protein